MLSHLISSHLSIIFYNKCFLKKSYLFLIPDLIFFCLLIVLDVSKYVKIFFKVKNMINQSIFVRRATGLQLIPKFDLKNPAQIPAIWIVDFNVRSLALLSANAYFPKGFQLFSIIHDGFFQDKLNVSIILSLIQL